MMGRRVVRRRRVVRAAAVGGIAYAGGKAAQRRQDDRAAEEQYPVEQEAPQPAGITADTVAQLEELAELKEKGILTDEEFAEQKARILG